MIFRQDFLKKKTIFNKRELDNLRVFQKEFICEEAAINLRAKTLQR